MRSLKTLFYILAINGLVLLMVSCAPSSATPTPTLQVITVKRSNIFVTVTGTGNLALQTKQELSFGQTGIASQATTAKISAVNVVAGQMVQQGQVLVKADTTDYQNQLVTDQHNLDSALAAVAQAQTNVDQSQSTLIQDQAALVKAQLTLSSQQDVQNIQNQIDNANIQLQQAKLLLQQGIANSNSSDTQYWNQQILSLSVNTNPAAAKSDGGQIGVLQKQMSALLSNPAYAGAAPVTGGATGAAQIQSDVLAVQQAQAKIVLDQANIINTQNSVVLAQNNVANAQTALNNDKNAAQEIDAPFNGLITQVNVTQGAILQRNATLIEIAVPDKFVANITVTEHDVLSLKLGETGVVSLNALTGYAYPAQISQIAPLATITQGVVNYQITVQLTSTTPETATGPKTSTSPSGTPAAGSSPAPSPSASSAPVTLKDGLSVLVTIPIQSKTNILILPNRAITTAGQSHTVQKIVGTATQNVTVQTGITDGTNTEIISGLNEGDQVLERSVAPTSGAGGFGGGGGFRVP